MKKNYKSYLLVASSLFILGGSLEAGNLDDRIGLLNEQLKAQYQSGKTNQAYSDMIIAREELKKVINEAEKVQQQYTQKGIRK